MSAAWRENYSIDFQKNCNKHINMDIVARERIVKNLKIYPHFG